MATPPDDQKDASSSPDASESAEWDSVSSPLPTRGTGDEEDERPDPVRLGILSTILVVLIAYWVWAILHPPPKPFYNDIPGISLRNLTEPQRAAVLREANAAVCDCGSDTCHFNVAECRHVEKTECDVSLRLAGEIVRKVTGTEPTLTGPMPPPMRGRAGTISPKQAATGTPLVR